MEKLTLKQIIETSEDPTKLRKGLKSLLGISRDFFSKMETGKKLIPLKYFIKLKNRFPNLDESQCPDYDQDFLELPPYPTENSDGGPPGKKAIPDSRHYRDITNSYNNQHVNVSNIAPIPNSSTYQENNLSIRVCL